MRITGKIMPYSTAILFSMLLFLVTVPDGIQARNRIDMAKHAASILTPFIKNYIHDLRRHRDSERIKIRVSMHNGDPQLNGCGFFFVATGHGGGTASDYFPKYEEHQCDHHRYRMRMTSQGVVYDNTIHLGNQHAKDVELHADGWYNTFSDVICFGFTERTIDGGPRAFCVNNLLLKGCKKLLNKWNEVDIDWDDLLMTRTTRGIHKLIFRDVAKVVHAMERLGRNPDDTDAIYTVCDRMELHRGGENANSWDCPAEKLQILLNKVESVASRNTENKNPYGCRHWRWGEHDSTSDV